MKNNNSIETPAPAALIQQAGSFVQAFQGAEGSQQQAKILAEMIEVYHHLRAAIIAHSGTENAYTTEAERAWLLAQQYAPNSLLNFHAVLNNQKLIPAAQLRNILGGEETLPWWLRYPDIEYSEMAHIFIPPEGLERIIVGEGNAALPDKQQAERTAAVIDYLLQDASPILGIDLRDTDLKIFMGAVRDNMMRRQSYNIIQVNHPALPIQIAVCDEIGNAMFTKTPIMDMEQWAALGKTNLVTFEKAVRIIMNTHWQAELLVALQNATITDVDLVMPTPRGAADMQAEEAVQAIASPTNHAQTRNKKLNDEIVFGWILEYIEKEGKIPSQNSGPVSGQDGEVWGNLQDLFRRGGRGLTQYKGLSEFINIQLRNLLLQQAEMFKTENGRPPTAADHTPIIPCHPTLTLSWRQMNDALLNSGKSKQTLAQFMMGDDRQVNYEIVFGWVLQHIQATGKIPNQGSGPVSGKDGEVWGNLNAVFRAGGRGLIGYDGLADFINIHLRSLLLRQAEIFKRKNGRAPTAEDNVLIIEGHPTFTLSWRQINDVLLSRGNSKQTLAQFMVGDDRQVNYEIVFGWVLQHIQATGRIPNDRSGPVNGQEGEVWRNINSAFGKRSRGLTNYGGLGEFISHQLRLLLLRQAEIFEKENGRQPTAVDDAPIIESDPTFTLSWRQMDNALQNRGSSKQTLVQFIAGDKQLNDNTVFSWVLEYIQATGRIPNDRSGPVNGQEGEVWANLNAVFVKGCRSLTQHKSLAEFINIQLRNVLLQQAEIFERKNGRAPTAVDDVPIVKDDPAFTLSWRQVDNALQNRGSSKQTLVQFMAGDDRQLTDDIIFIWALKHIEINGKIPNQNSGLINELEGEVWNNIDAAFRKGRRGLTKYGGLSPFITNRIKTYLQEFQEKHGRLPCCTADKDKPFIVYTGPADDNATDVKPENISINCGEFLVAVFGSHAATTTKTVYLKLFQSLDPNYKPDVPKKHNNSPAP